MSLVRFALHQADTLAPFEEMVKERFAGWLAKEIAGGCAFTSVQLRWLELIRDHVAASLHVETGDFEYVPFTNMGGLGAAYDVFGDGLYPILDELNEVLVS